MHTLRDVRVNIDPLDAMHHSVGLPDETDPAPGEVAT